MITKKKYYKGDQPTRFEDRKVLVLSKSWLPIKCITLESAFKKIAGTYKDGTPKAKIIDCVNDFQLMTWEDWSKLRPKEGEEGIRSVNAIFRVPTVIMYTRFDKVPVTKVHYNRRTIFRRDKNTCCYCGKKLNLNIASIDHVVPRCQGGKSTWTNTVTSCVDCNARKAGRTPEQAGMKLLIEPKKPKHNFHFGDVIVKDWTHFISEAYMSVELENDNKD